MTFLTGIAKTVVLRAGYSIQVQKRPVRTGENRLFSPVASSRVVLLFVLGDYTSLLRHENMVSSLLLMEAILGIRS